MLDRLMMALNGHRISAHVASRARYPMLLALLPLLTACGSKERAPPPYEANPSPKEAYEVVVTTHDAPEDIFASAAYVTYRISNEDCLPPIDNFEGVRYGLEKHSLDIQLNRVDASTFAGEYFGDGLLSKDYFGKGVCNWRIDLVGATLKTDRTKSFTYFSIAISGDEKETVLYSSKDIRPKLDNEVVPATTLSRENLPDSADERNDGYFSMTITTRPRKDNR